MRRTGAVIGWMRENILTERKEDMMAIGFGWSGRGNKLADVAKKTQWKGAGERIDM